ncbi:MAG: hypothetical protein GY788_28445, partial [bacterium]|nr:hypothetical protein [bacterium]
HRLAHAGIAKGRSGPQAVTTIAGTENAIYCHHADCIVRSGAGREMAYRAFDNPVTVAKDTIIGPGYRVKRWRAADCRSRANLVQCN